MATVYTDQFWLIDTTTPVPGTTLAVHVLDMTDQHSDSYIDYNFIDMIDGSNIHAAYLGDKVTVLLPNGQTVTITGVSFILEDGRRLFTPTDGSILKEATLISAQAVGKISRISISSLGPSCFTAGTMISTPHGKVNIENLLPGETVSGIHNSSLMIEKIFRRRINRVTLALNDKLRPIRITSGALGNGLPQRDLLVSRQHRILIKSKIAKRMFGTDEVLIAAIRLTDIPGIFIDYNVTSVEYIHLLFKKHEIIYAESAPTESLFLDIATLTLTGDPAYDEMYLIFSGKPPQEMACLIPSNKRQKKLIERHIFNKKPLYLGDIHT